MSDPAREQLDRDAAALLQYTETHKLTNAQRLAVLGARDWMLTADTERKVMAAELQKDGTP